MNARILILLCCFLGSSVRLPAVIIYSTYGPDLYVPTGIANTFGWGVTVYDGGIVMGGGSSLATPFLFSGPAYRLESITLDIGRNSPENTPNMEIGIYGEDDGHPSLTPITVLQPNETFTTVARHSISYSFPVQSVLQAEVHYWLVLQPKIYAIPDEAYSVQYTISTSSVNPPAGAAARSFTYPDSSTWGNWTLYPNGPAPVFRLDGVAVPEPSMWALFALGSAAFWGIARRRRK